MGWVGMCVGWDMCEGISMGILQEKIRDQRLNV